MILVVIQEPQVVRGTQTLLAGGEELINRLRCLPWLPGDRAGLHVPVVYFDPQSGVLVEDRCLSRQGADPAHRRLFAVVRQIAGGGKL